MVYMVYLRGFVSVSCVVLYPVRSGLYDFLRWIFQRGNKSAHLLTGLRTNSGAEYEALYASDISRCQTSGQLH